MRRILQVPLLLFVLAATAGCENPQVISAMERLNIATRALGEQQATNAAVASILLDARRFDNVTSDIEDWALAGHITPQEVVMVNRHILIADKALDVMQDATAEAVEKMQAKVGFDMHLGEAEFWRNQWRTRGTGG